MTAASRSAFENSRISPGMVQAPPLTSVRTESRSVGTTAIRSNEKTWESPSFPSCHIPPAVKPVKRVSEHVDQSDLLVGGERVLDRTGHSGVIVGGDLPDSLETDDAVVVVPASARSFGSAP